MTFRHPLRNDWDEFRRTLEPLKAAPTRDGAMARAMLALMPAYLAYIEDVRDRAERDSDVLLGLTAALANIVTQTVRQTVPGDPRAQREALHLIVHTIEREAKKRMTARGPTMTGGLIVPGGG